MKTNSDIESTYLDAGETIFSMSDFALDYGLMNVKESGGPLIPFLATNVNGQISLDRYFSENYVDGLEQARKQIELLSEEIEAYALAYDGYVTVDNQKYDAILVEIGERGNQKGYKFAQRYQPKKFLKSFSLIGNQMFLGNFHCQL